MGLFDAQDLPIECPNCKHKTPKSIAWIKQHSELTCTCGATIRIDSDELLAGLRKAEDMISRLEKSKIKLKF